MEILLNVAYSSIVDNKFNKIFNVKSGNAAVTLDYNWWGNNSVCLMIKSVNGL